MNCTYGWISRLKRARRTSTLLTHPLPCQKVCTSCSHLRTLTKTSSCQAPFILKNIPGKGQGLIASRPIVTGELVLSEAPLITQRRPVTNATILATLSYLTDTDQRRYFALANAWRGVHPPPLGIFTTNCLPCGDNDQSRGLSAGSAAIFLLGSRFNSSCEPNINNYWNENLGEITFWAVRDIAEGEELCICYGNPLGTRADRRRKLEAAFRFVCNCVACARDSAALESSDDRRVAISHLYVEIAECGSKPAVGVRKVRLLVVHSCASCM